MPRSAITATAIDLVDDNVVDGPGVIGGIAREAF